MGRSAEVIYLFLISTASEGHAGIASRTTIFNRPHGIDTGDGDIYLAS